MTTQTARTELRGLAPAPGRSPLSPRFIRRLGVFVVLWAALWIGMGVWTWDEVRTLRQLGSTMIESGRAVEQTGGALQGLGAIPLFGVEVAGIGRQVSAAGGDAQRSGRTSQAAAANLAVLLGVSIALVPSVPMLALYLVARRLARRPELD